MIKRFREQIYKRYLFKECEYPAVNALTDFVVCGLIAASDVR